MRLAHWFWLGLCTTLVIGAISLVAATASEDVIVLGAAVSLTGKYAQNGVNTKNGYDLAARKINDLGGVVIGGKSYKIVLRYYDDEFDSGARHRTRRAADPAGRRQIPARALQLRPDQGHPADLREAQSADDRGERRCA